ncbi:MAG: hypothetical protein K0B87_00145 [Candidatus Syntrophosphaera sp.]|nr:hypothetical protein [Candidatus Syntrophosphaera sp.]
MKKSLFLFLLLFVLVAAHAQFTEPRSYIQSVILDNGQIPTLTWAEEKSAEEYLVRAWMLERPDEILSTDEHSVWHLNLLSFGDDIEYPVTAVVILEMGNFASRWEVGETIHLEVTHKASGELVEWEITVPEGSGPITILDTPQLIPPFSKAQK